MTSTDMNTIQVGDHVWVTRPVTSLYFAEQANEAEPGVVLQVSAQQFLIKLTISNVRGMFEASQVSKVVVGDTPERPPKRRSSTRSRRVTPDPSTTNDNDTDEAQPPLEVDPDPVARQIHLDPKVSGESATTSTGGGSSSATEDDDEQEEEEEEEEDDPPLAFLKKKASPALASLKKKASAATTRTNNKRKAAAVQEEKKVVDEDVATVANAPSWMLQASDSDSDDEKDMPYRIEYAATGRATCKGCDVRITKQELRIAERPLFRGKPGFVVYRHLSCTVFQESIQDISHVGGWRRLKTQRDCQKLRDRIEESKELIQQEQQELQPNELVQVGFQGEIRPSPPGLAATLLPFQVEGASWMYHQEVNVPEIRGGILADEMGMGKTIQSIVTILDNRPKLQHCKPGMKHPPSAPDLQARKDEERVWKESLDLWKHEMNMANVPKKFLAPSKKGGTRAGTLVVCPVIALLQWKQEIEKFTNVHNPPLTIACYHGPNRIKEYPMAKLSKYDVVLTTYQVIESDFRKMVSPNKIKCPNCQKPYKIDKLRVHLKYFCGATAQRTEAQSRQRRTADRHVGRGGGGRGGRGSGGRSGRGGSKKPKKKSMAKTPTKTKTTNTKKKKKKKKDDKKQPTPTKNKRVLRVQKLSGYDSDSDLSVPEDMDLHSPRPRRSAATAAAQRLSSSAKQWSGGHTKDDDSDSFEDPLSSSEDDDNEDSSAPTRRRGDQKQVAKRIPESSSDDDSESSDDSESEDDDNAMSRARKRQRLALESAAKNRKVASKTTNKKKPLDKKTTGKQLKSKKPPLKKGKKPLPSDSSSSESSSEDDDDDDRNDDPLNGIDLEALMAEAMEGCRASVLHNMCWWRIVLDEAHMIKSRSSQTAASAFALTSIHRWCLSGTPLQNRVGELYSLIRFLRIDPMAHYMCRKEGCDCKSIHYRMLHGKCQDCGHSSIQHFSYFNKHVLNPIQRAGYQGDGRRAMMKLKDDVMDQCLLRRTKQSRAEDMNLPPRVVNIRTIRLHPIEEDFYNALYTQTKSSFDDYVTEGTLLNNYAHIFDLLTKMRQAVDHPYLIVYSKKNTDQAAQMNNGSNNRPPVANGSIDCELCHEPPTDRVVSSCCESAFCRSCVLDFMSAALDEATAASTICPCCNHPLSVDLNQASQDVEDDDTLEIKASKYDNPSAGMPSLKEMTHVSSGSILRRMHLAEFATSTKIEALVEELVQMRQQRPGSKALVFSQFVNMLDLIRWRLHSDPCLQDLGVGVRIIHGGMNIQSRAAALKDFKEDPTVRVLLMSLKAGGVALNLTVANEAYLMDPWWNPAAEMQAIDRTHRLGQYRPIRAVRFIAEGTVEERVLQLQEKKRLVFDGTVGRDAASLKMLTVDDMKALFA